MWTFDAKARHLRLSSDKVSIAALAAALHHCDDSELPELLAHLLDLAEQPAGPGWRAIEAALPAWPRLDPSARAALFDSARLGLASWIQHHLSTNDPALAHRISADLAIALHDPSDPAHTLIDPEAFSAIIDQALAHAAARDDLPRHARLLTAIIACAHHPGPALRAFLSDADHPAHMPLRAEARRAAATIPSAQLIRWLSTRALAPIAREFLEDRLLAREEEAFSSAHLLLLPPRAAEIKRFTRLDRYFQRGSLAQLSEPARRGALQWMRLAPIRPATALAVLSSLVADPSPAVRLDAARALARFTPTPESDQVLRDYALDADEAVATVAARALISAASPARRRSLQSFIETLRRSPHEPIRAILAEVPADPPRRATTEPVMQGASA